MTQQFPFLSCSDIRYQENLALLTDLENGSYESLLRSDIARSLFSGDETLHLPSSSSADASESSESSKSTHWSSHVQHRLEVLVRQNQDRHAGVYSESLFLIGLAAFQAFLQSNVTGPPLTWSPAETCLPRDIAKSPSALGSLRAQLVADLTVDGSAAYALTPNVELLWLAKKLLAPRSEKEVRPPKETSKGEENEMVDVLPSAWARMRVNFWHQRMLDEPAQGLQDAIYADLTTLEGLVLGAGSGAGAEEERRVLFLLERAAVETFHGFDARARKDLETARLLRGFEYVLTGRLGKRTKFQERELSQLVVLAKSRDDGGGGGDGEAETEGESNRVAKEQQEKEKVPANLDLNDDTLLETISFSKEKPTNSSSEDNLPSSLASIDPSNQPLLHPLDSIILLSLASSITNTSPEHGLTREETLPYATRVLEGGSSNWQVYTQALLVRSRIEGYRSRTVERGVLQLQALVDQVIADTTGGGADPDTNGDAPTTFLPRPKVTESAPVTERLQYINQLATPPRWALEAELASRWVSLGGLRTALEIYERLRMWAEVALCWAATDREDKAIRIVRRQLYMPEDTSSSPIGEVDEDAIKYTGAERTPLPPDAPRLFCILGDLEKEPEHYERAWAVSKQRYARAQRSLGKHYLKAGDLQRADEAYSKSLAINHQNAGTWFALGCVRLSTENWSGAVHAFSRSLQIENEDGEAWSNLAAALLQLPAPESSDHQESAVAAAAAAGFSEEDDYDTSNEQTRTDPQKYTKQAFAALKRAAALKRDSYRIWQNVLTVATRLSPPPYADIVFAQRRLIELRSKTEGEGCVEVAIMEGVLAHIIATSSSVPSNDSDRTGGTKYGLSHMFTTLVTTQIVPLITRSRRLWQLVARLYLHLLNRPSAALDATEKGWRVALNQPGWDDSSSPSTSSSWQAVLDATEELVDAYESLGEREATEGLKTYSSASIPEGEEKMEKELVCPNWKYKARMAVRAVVGRRVKAGFDVESRGEERLQRLRQRVEALK